MYFATLRFCVSLGVSFLVLLRGGVVQRALFGRLGEAAQALLLTLFGSSGRPYLPALPLRSLLRGADVHFLVFRLFIRTKKVRLLQQTNVATLVQPLYDRPLNPPCQRRRILECSLF